MRKFDPVLIQEIIDMPNRPAVVATVKTLNLGIGKWKEQSSCVDGAIDIADLTRIYDETREIRDKCRQLICVRTGLSILMEKKQEAIDSYYAESKRALVSVPKSLRAQLERLRAQGAAGDGDDNQDDDDDDDGACENAGVSSDGNGDA